VTTAIGIWSSEPAFVQVRGLTCGYRLGQPGEVIALRGLNLELASGELLALVGGGGSGKTTLLRVLAGLARPAAGQVLVEELNLGLATEAELDEYRRQLVGYVAQPPESGLWQALTVLQNVQAPMLAGGVGPEERPGRAAQLLETLRLATRHHHHPGQLAGGDLLRLALAVALANRPPLLLLDEPTGALDPDTTATVLDDLLPLLGQLGTAVLIASRNQELAPYMDRVSWIAGAPAPA
jgi:putative ABC transport system ATP-binding protein